jgi:hypothetical protein
MTHRETKPLFRWSRRATCSLSVWISLLRLARRSLDRNRDRAALSRLRIFLAATLSPCAASTASSSSETAARGRREESTGELLPSASVGWASRLPFNGRTDAASASSCHNESV